MDRFTNNPQTLLQESVKARWKDWLNEGITWGFVKELDKLFREQYKVEEPPATEEQWREFEVFIETENRKGGK